MFFHISNRTEQALLFTTPQRNTNRTSRFDSERLQNSCSFHHDRATDRIVSRSSRGVPGIEMATEHDHFIGFVAATNLTYRVVGSSAFGIDAIDDIKFENDFGAVIEF